MWLSNGNYYFLISNMISTIRDSILEELEVYYDGEINPRVRNRVRVLVVDILTELIPCGPDLVEVRQDLTDTTMMDRGTLNIMYRFKYMNEYITDTVEV